MSMNKFEAVRSHSNGLVTIVTFHSIKEMKNVFEESWVLRAYKIVNGVRKHLIKLDRQVSSLDKIDSNVKAMVASVISFDQRLSEKKKAIPQQITIRKYV